MWSALRAVQPWTRGFLPVGHTHEDIDQQWACMAELLRQILDFDLLGTADYLKLARMSHVLHPTGDHLGNVLDMKKFLEDIEPAALANNVDSFPTGITQGRSFRFFLEVEGKRASGVRMVWKDTMSGSVEYPPLALRDLPDYRFVYFAQAGKTPSKNSFLGAGWGAGALEPSSEKPKSYCRTLDGRVPRKGGTAPDPEVGGGRSRPKKAQDQTKRELFEKSLKLLRKMPGANVPESLIGAAGPGARGP